MRNVCGDGLILDGVEECDDGDANDDTAPCTSACLVNVCGDGLALEGVEECDDGGQFVDGGDGCSATCTREQVVFATPVLVFDPARDALNFVQSSLFSA